jgi:hypothetical protein
MVTYELLVKLPGDRVSRHVLWNGSDGVATARNYVAEHPGATVFAFRKPVAPLTVLTNAGRIDG